MNVTQLYDKLGQEMGLNKVFVHKPIVENGAVVGAEMLEVKDVTRRFIGDKEVTIIEVE